MAEVALRLAPGSGLLARRPRALLFSATADAGIVAAFAGAPEGAELQAVASATVAAGFEVGPFVGLSWDGGLRVMAFGDVAVETDQPSLPMLSGAGSRTWVEHTVPASERAVVEVGGADAEEATDLVAGTVLAGGFRLELGLATGTTGAPAERAGTPPDATTSVPRMEHTAVLPQPESPVDAEPAPGAEVSPAEEPPETDSAEPVAAATIALQAPEPVDVDPDDPVASLAAIQAAAVGPDGQPFEPPGGPPGAPAAPSAPSARHEAVPENAEPDADAHDPDVTLPPPVSEAVLADVRSAEVTDSRGSLVDAKLCANGHANPPTAATCGVCAEFLTPGASAVVHVPRPSLGRLQLDNGELVELDQELLIGRNPDRDQDPARASLRRVKTLGDKVSRSHLEVRFQGWDVLVADCRSTNGTFVVPHAGGQVVVLEPGRPQMIDAGAVVYFGSRSFTLLGREESA